jgi:hypothetical protein
VHEGHRPNVAEAHAALEEARGVLIAIGRGLHGDPATKEVGAQLVTFIDEVANEQGP